MPNHIHAVILIDRAHMECVPTLIEIIQSFKRHSTVLYCKLVHSGLAQPFQRQLRQRSFYDRVIRNDAEYEAALKYIDENPLKWILNHQTPHPYGRILYPSAETPQNRANGRIPDALSQKQRSASHMEHHVTNTIILRSR